MINSHWYGAGYPQLRYKCAGEMLANLAATTVRHIHTGPDLQETASTARSSAHQVEPNICCAVSAHQVTWPADDAVSAVLDPDIPGEQNKVFDQQAFHDDGSAPVTPEHSWLQLARAAGIRPVVVNIFKIHAFDLLFKAAAWRWVTQLSIRQ